MKEWLKEFAKVCRISGLMVEDDKFITDYLKDHPLPLPSDEEIAEKAKGEQIDVKWGFVTGALWCREKMEG